VLVTCLLQLEDRHWQAVEVEHHIEAAPGVPVDAYADGGQSNLINEIGHYAGEVQLPDATFLITIHADGTWTLTHG
jgi:hypothetical protein